MDEASQALKKSSGRLANHQRGEDVPAQSATRCDSHRGVAITVSMTIIIVFGLTAIATVLGAVVLYSVSHPQMPFEADNTNSALFEVTLFTFSIRLHAARRSEHQNNHGIPLVSPNCQHMNDERSQATNPKGGFEVPA